MLTVDKIEGKIVRVEKTEESGEICYIEADASLFDSEVREGDVIISDENGHYSRDDEMTAHRKKEILDLQNSLWE
ncbi:MAG: DUF3006 domain-containing protein [Oscillospiraceae bacterium]|nr:DUF3006 domain-containing protein [Oscillospiraceae bacterium]